MEWKIRRGNDEFTARDEQMLSEWAASGRLLPSDYVFNPTLQRWMYAHETAELSNSWPNRHSSGKSRSGCAASIALGLLSLMFFMWNMEIIGLALLLGAVIALVLAAIAQKETSGGRR